MKLPHVVATVLEEPFAQPHYSRNYRFPPRPTGWQEYLSVVQTSLPNSSRDDFGTITRKEQLRDLREGPSG